MIIKMFKNIPKSLLKSFAGYNFFWHILAVVSTYFLAVSGFDWFYYGLMAPYFAILIPSALIGLFVPVILPIWLFVRARIKKDAEALKAALLLGEAELAALFLTYFYKALTGRAHPTGSLFGVETLTDLTRTFQFGFLKGGILWGWPSSHTTVAFALAVTVWFVYKEKKWVRALAVIFALYVGIGISGTLHWFSDFTAGVIFGTLVGFVATRKIRMTIKGQQE